MKKQSNHKKHKLGSTIVAITLAMSAMSSVYAEPTGDKDYELEPVVVTATKTPLKISEANANVYVITREQIERNHYHDLSQALKTVPGIDMSNFGDVGYEYDNTNYIRINGAEKIVVLIDGIRANIADMYFPINTYVNMDQVERIEVIKGSASVLYGSNAKGGVINIITRAPEKNQTKLKFSGGSFGKENYNIFHAGKSSDTSWLISAQKDILSNMKDGRGDIREQHLNASTATFKLSQKLYDGSNLTFVYDTYGSDVHRKGSRLDTSPPLFGQFNTNNLRIIHEKKNSDKSENRFSFMISNYDYSYQNAVQSTNADIQTIVLQEQYTMRAGENHRVVLGFDYSNDDIRQLESSAIIGALILKRGINNHELSEYSFYAQDEWDITKKWKLTTGLRYTNNSSFGSHIGPNINLSLKPTDKTNYYVSYNSYYIAPDARSLFGATTLEMMGMSIPMIIPNSDLEPESGRTIEFGVNHNFNETTSAAFHMYKRKSNDVLGTEFDMNLGVDRIVNVDEETTKGWDIQLNKRLSNKWDAFVGYTYTSLDSSAYPGMENKAGMIPKGTVNVGASYNRENYDIGFEARYVIDRNGSAPEYFPKNDYWVCNLSANYKFTDAITAFARVNNIFNTYYAEQSNGPNNWYSAPGRNLVAGMQYSF